MSQVLFAFFTRPVAGETAPGMPMPTVPVSPVSDSSAATRSRIAATVSSYEPRGAGMRLRARSMPVLSRAMPSILVPPRSMPMRMGEFISFLF